VSTINANDSPSTGGSLRQRRRRLNISQEDLARLADCSTGYVRLLERGFQPEHSDVLPRVIAALDSLNDNAPGAQAGREVTTSAVVGDGHGA
jgi:predicted transcriptional regulator